MIRPAGEGEEEDKCLLIDYVIPRRRIDPVVNSPVRLYIQTARHR